MTRDRLFMTLGVIALTWSLGPVAEGQALELAELSGGSVKTSLGFGIAVNKESSLERRWFTVNDPAAPVQLSRSGVDTSYHERSYSFRPAGSAKATEPVAAVEIRFLLFDVWGGHLTTLAATEIRDFTAAENLELKKIGSWRASEGDVSKYLTSVAYVSRVRTQDGRLWAADPDAVTRMIEDVQLEMSEESLAPTNNDN